MVIRVEKKMIVVSFDLVKVKMNVCFFLIIWVIIFCLVRGLKTSVVFGLVMLISF